MLMNRWWSNSKTPILTDWSLKPRRNRFHPKELWSANANNYVVVTMAREKYGSAFQRDIS